MCTSDVRWSIEELRSAGLLIERIFKSELIVGNPVEDLMNYAPLFFLIQKQITYGE